MSGPFIIGVSLGLGSCRLDRSLVVQQGRSSFCYKGVSSVHDGNLLMIPLKEFRVEETFKILMQCKSINDPNDGLIAKAKAEWWP